MTNVTTSSIMQWIDTSVMILLSLACRSLWAKIRNTPTKEDLKTIDDKIEKRIEDKIQLSLIGINQHLAVMSQAMKAHTKILDKVTKTVLNESGSSEL